MPKSVVNYLPSVVKAVELAATGQSHPVIAKVLGCSVRTVDRLLSDPQVKQALSVLRQGLRVKALESAQANATGLQEWLAEVIKAKKDPKAADALSRAILNQEKAVASASGENRPHAQPAQQVEINVAPGWLPKEPWSPGLAKPVIVVQNAAKPPVTGHPWPPLPPPRSSLKPHPADEP